MIELSLADCLYWLRIVDEVRAPRLILFYWAPVLAASRRDVRGLYREAKAHLDAVRARRRYFDACPPKYQQAEIAVTQERINLVTWALCRAAIRAIEEQR